MRIRGVDYHVSEWGDDASPLVVFLHGWGDTGSTFQFVVDELQHDWFVVAPDWRGFGASHFRAESYWFPDYLADLDRLLDAYSPGQPVRLVAHSMGANVAGLYAGTMPERVLAFVNLEGFGLPDSDPAEAPGRYRRWLELQRRREPFREFADFDALERHVLARNPRMSEARAAFVARAWGISIADGVELRADPAHKLPNPVLYRRAETEACWRRITAPVLLLSGSESELLKRLRDAVPGVEPALPIEHAVSRVIAGCGHMLHFDAPAAVAGAMEEFLASL
jgi:pimeloyl-ACP methyl ester carboxylesterase